jgi:hypothetical protein
LENSKKMKKMMIVTVLLVAAFLSAMIAPTFAAAPTAIDDAWFVIPIFVKSPGSPAPAVSITPDKVWTSDDGNVLHCMNTQISTYLAHTPTLPPPQVSPPSGSVRWGTVTAVSNFVFDKISNTGTYTMKITLTLKETTTTQGVDPTLYPNTYGIGTLEGTLVAKVTNLNPYVASNLNCPMPGNGQGIFVATHGTGAFANAKLMAGVTLEPGQAGTAGSIGIEYLFIGHHINHLYNDGSITFHNPGKSN